MTDLSEFRSGDVGSKFDAASDIESLSRSDFLRFTSLLVGGT